MVSPVAEGSMCNASAYRVSRGHLLDYFFEEEEVQVACGGFGCCCGRARCCKVSMVRDAGFVSVTEVICFAEEDEV